MVRSIPKKLLIHSVIYTPPATNDGWDDAPGEPVTIDHVRVEPSKSYRYESDSTVNAPTHVVFVDREHSTTFPDFKLDSGIKWNGDDYKISKVKPHYEFDDTPHHYELELV